MEVARALSSQKPGESESCLSLSILASLLATSKKPPQDQHTVSHILNLFCCHAAKLGDNIVSDHLSHEVILCWFGSRQPIATLLSEGVSNAISLYEHKLPFMYSNQPNAKQVFSNIEKHITFETQSFKAQITSTNKILRNT